MQTEEKDLYVCDVFYIKAPEHEYIFSKYSRNIHEE